MIFEFNHCTNNLTDKSDLSDKELVQLPHIQSFLQTNNLQTTMLSEIAKDNSRRIIFDDNHVYLAMVKEICGIRYILTHTSHPIEQFISSSIFNAVEIDAKNTGVQLIQFYSGSDNNLLPFLANSWRMSNFRFEHNLNQTFTGDPLELISMDFREEWFSKRGAQLELVTRWDMAGSTVFDGDRMNLIRPEYNEYPQLYDLKIANGLYYQEKTSVAFVTWFKNAVDRSAIISLFWVDPCMRGRGIGFALMTQALKKIAEDSIKLNYVVSATNIPMINTLVITGFQFKYFIYNRDVR